MSFIPGFDVFLVLQFVAAVFDFVSKAIAALGAAKPPNVFGTASTLSKQTLSDYATAVRAEFSLAPVSPLATALLVVTSSSGSQVRASMSTKMASVLQAAGERAWLVPCCTE